MKWYEYTGAERDTVVSTRVRLARNINGYPFGDRLTDGARREIIEKVSGALPKASGFILTDMSELTRNQRHALAEEHLISREFAEEKRPSALISKEDDGIYVMVGEEDHIRLQCILAGFDPDEAYRRAAAADSAIDSSLDIAYSDKLGYLTHCPTNAGTGMRVSVMMFLPALTAHSAIRSLSGQLEKLGMTIRGSYGEGSRADGCLYQISNQVTLKISEEDTLAKLKQAITAIAARERELRNAVKGDDALRLRDRLMRSYGIMRHAELIPSAEMLELYANVRLGAAMKLVPIAPSVIDALLIKSMPAVTVPGGGKEAERLAASPIARDQRRAELWKNELK